MKKIMMLIVFSLLIEGCAQQKSPEERNISFEYAEVIETCNTLCETDANAYCEQKRTITLNGIDVEGTCRAFSRNGNVPGFERCERFCNTYDKAGTECKVNGEADPDCNGIIS